MNPISIKKLSKLKPKPGDVIYLKQGTYKDLQVSINFNGTLKSPITILPSAGTIITLTGKSNLKINGSYTTVVGLKFHKCTSNKTIKIAGHHNRVNNIELSNHLKDCEKMVQITGQYSTVDHSYFHDFNTLGCIVCVDRPNDDPNYAMIDSCVFENRKPVQGENNGQECIRVGDSKYSLSKSYSVVSNNLFKQVDGEIEIISVKSGKNTIKHNTIYESEGCITLRHGNESQVICNEILQNGKPNTGGIRITGSDHYIFNNHISEINGNGTMRVGISLNCGVNNSPLNRYHQVDNCVIKKNLIVNCSNAFAIGVKKNEANLKPTDVFIVDNTIISELSTPLFSDDKSCIGSDLYFERNKFYGHKLGRHGQNHEILNPDDCKLDLEGKCYGCDESIGLNDNDYELEPCRECEFEDSESDSESDSPISDTEYEPDSEKSETDSESDSDSDCEECIKSTDLLEHLLVLIHEHLEEAN